MTAYARFRHWAIGATVLVLALLGASPSQARPPHTELKDGRLYVKGQWRFLKIAKPLRNFADPAQVAQLQKVLPILKAKNYNSIALNCYWHHFDPNGDGQIDFSLKPLRQLIQAIEAQGMFVSLSVETYAVGGGSIPPGFWKAHPDALAVNAQGHPVRDTEYGFNTAVPSHFCPAYLTASREFIRNLAKGLPSGHFLYFETSVEPQYMGNQALDFSSWAKTAYQAWLKKHHLDGPAWPGTFPVPAKFLGNPVWNRFRAEALAQWVNGDAQAFRSVAGSDAWVAVDYLETCGPEMSRRNGNSEEFLAALQSVNIIQVNWHWNLVTRSSNTCAYEHVRNVMKEKGRHWVITEHMTLNGSDFKPEEVPAILRDTLKNGTLFGWEFTNIGANSADPFCLYNDDWSPKPLMAQVDDHWAQWMKEVKQAGKKD